MAFGLLAILRRPLMQKTLLIAATTRQPCP